ncbi:A/G-specific adenine glycosylase [Aristaeella lactis]|uniref:A/G-specific DNA-adenine glycosylase n=1 Tax=Aristaeella lactis TaxID=3046383 RepID=A0AC61PJC4_9FIRM|nr:A/G-specific adenine glycosylase [Aristaeella lactis]QUA53989.1 A/G-specific adenine glycosylase [Aristaeella lactis]SMC42011.1 A/G-specific DNA-adenine glycosylase [Aristaeella lactis]
MHPLTAALLDWYDRCARDLPWRGFHDAYRTWVSEAMLQQTRVETVLSYYDRFLSRFPTLPALAEAPEADVLKAWEGLGYYSRARNLHNGAMDVMEQYGGVLPRDPEKLKKIRGIGPYTAGAIASIAYDVPVPAVDGNVIRVLSRIYGIRTDALQPDTRKHIEELAAALVPEERPGDHNQAVMDLGATVCVPGTPDCAVCPLSAFCDACKAGDASDLPVLPKAKPQKVIPYAVLLIRSGDRVLMRRRTERLLQGLWCFPMFEGESHADELLPVVSKKLHLSLSSLRDAGPARHVFTHQVWQMRIYETDAEASASAPAGYEFIPLDHLKDLTLPAAMNAAVKVLTRQA